MKDFNELIDRVKSSPQKIVLPETSDLRVLAAAAKLCAEKVADVVLPGNPDAIEKLADDNAINISGAQIVDQFNNGDDYAQSLFELRQHKGMTPEQARDGVIDPLTFASVMVQRGEADGCVAGAQYATASVVRSALQIIGMHPDYKLVSSFFIMLFDKPFHTYPGVMLFADCGLVIAPDPEQLASIAVATADTAKNLLGIDPRVAMLSFSTQGSATHELVEKVVDATSIAKNLRPDYDIFGDVQLDAAIEPQILAQKAPQLASDRKTNVLIFPGLEAGNIGYKLVQRFAQADAIGPILQGLKKPVNDLSRGCSADDVYRAAILTSLQAAR